MERRSGHVLPRRPMGDVFFQFQQQLLFLVQSDFVVFEFIIFQFFLELIIFQFFLEFIIFQQQFF